MRTDGRMGGGRGDVSALEKKTSKAEKKKKKKKTESNQHAGA
jgi:hypothetical protein